MHFTAGQVKKSLTPVVVNRWGNVYNCLKNTFRAVECRFHQLWIWHQRVPFAVGLFNFFPATCSKNSGRLSLSDGLNWYFKQKSRLYRNYFR